LTINQKKKKLITLYINKFIKIKNNNYIINKIKLKEINNFIFQIYDYISIILITELISI
jgi:hypothetical protein